VATHWDLNGTPNGFSSRGWAVALVPLLMLFMTGLFNLLPKLDPRRQNYASFLSTYWLIVNGIILFLGLVHVAVIAAALGFPVKIERVIPLGLGVLFVFLGNYLRRVEPNWFVGIRTPWTLSSDTVWRKTHRTGGRLMVIGGLVLVAAALLPRVAFLPLFFATIIVVAVIPIVQSYVLWKREQEKP
jgi:uncharacterized membrane protein